MFKKLKNSKTLLIFIYIILFASFGYCYLKLNNESTKILETLGVIPLSCYLNSGKEIERKEILRNEFGLIARVVINSCGKNVFLYEAIPANISEDTPIVIALHQTSNFGKDEVMGFDGNANLAYGRTYFENGFIVISPDIFLAGDNYDPTKGWDTSHFYSEFPKWSAMGRMLEDHLAVSRYVEKKLSPKCIAVAGHSLGGHNALFLGAFNKKIDVIISSAGFEGISLDRDATRWARDSQFVYMPLLKPYVKNPPPRTVPWDFDDILRMVSPRPVLILQGLRDETWTNLGSVAEIISEVSNESTSSNTIDAIFHQAGHEFGEALQLESLRFLMQSCNVQKKGLTFVSLS